MTLVYYDTKFSRFHDVITELDCTIYFFFFFAKLLYILTFVFIYLCCSYRNTGVMKFKVILKHEIISGPVW